MSGYVINPTTGLLTAMTGSPFAAGMQPVNVTVGPSGRFVYVTNSGDNTLSGYTIDPTSGVLTPSFTSSLAATNGFGGGCTVPGPLTVDPRGLMLYVSCPASNNTFVTPINTSTGGVGHVAQHGVRLCLWGH